MWMRTKELQRPVLDKQGRPWYFQMWWDHVEGIMVQRVFFWDEHKKTTGLFELAGESVIHFYKLRQRIERLAKDPAYRRKYIKKLRFPLERHY